MSESPIVYRKHNSFVAIRYKTVLRDVTARIERCRQGLDAAGLSDHVRTVVADVCDELLRGALGAPEPVFTLHGNVVEEIERLSDEELPRYLFYRYRYETYPQRHIVDDFPPCLQIEPTSICNYRCVFCYQTDRTFTAKSSGQMGQMSLDTFKQIVDQAAGRCEAVTLASRGEPLLCRDIEAMLAHVAGKFLALKLNTNAWYLDERKCHAILESGFNTVVFSADAAIEPTYRQLRVNGNLERVVANVRRFCDIRERHYPTSRTITRVAGVEVPEADSLDRMEHFWREFVDQVAFVKYNPWENTYERPLNGLGAPCSDLWRRMFVWWDGTVNPCDVDYRSTLAIGNVHDTALTELWRGEGYRLLRNHHLGGRRAECAPCNRCTFA